MPAAPDNAAPRYQIGDLILDTGSRSVMRGTEALKLPGLTFELLLALVTAAPAIASYDVLVEQVWNGREASPETIAQRAAMLRSAIGDDAHAPRYFELVRGQGYRWIADVQVIDDQAASGPSKPRWMIAALIMLLIAATFAYIAKLDRPVAASVAVLPFADLSAADDHGYLADGLAEELINELAGLQGLDVASRSESFAFRGAAKDLQKIGVELDVATILEGSIRRSDDALRVTVQLIEVDTGYHLWSQNFDSDLSDIFDIQEAIAMSVAGALGVKLGVGGVNEFKGAGTRNYAAYEAFLRQDFETAVRLDPDYAGAWSRRGLKLAATMWASNVEQAPEIMEPAYRYVARALELDPDSAQVNIDYATVVYAMMRWHEAEAAFMKARALNNSPQAIYHHANMMMRAGRSRLALEYRDRARSLERLPQVTSTWLAFGSFAQIALGDATAARELAAQMQPEVKEFTELSIALNFGSEDDVLAAIQALPAGTPDYTIFYSELLALWGTPDQVIAFLVEIADDPHRNWPFKYETIAVLAAYFDHPEIAFDVFARELRHTTTRYGTLWYPVMADMRQLPEFRQLLVDVKLVDYWRDYGWADFCYPVSETDFACK